MLISGVISDRDVGGYRMRRRLGSYSMVHAILLPIFVAYHPTANLHVGQNSNYLDAMRLFADSWMILV